MLERFVFDAPTGGVDHHRKVQRPTPCGSGAIGSGEARPAPVWGLSDAEQATLFDRKPADSDHNREARVLIGGSVTNYAHSLRNGPPERWHSLADHLEDTGDRTAALAAKWGAE